MIGRRLLAGVLISLAGPNAAIMFNGLTIKSSDWDAQTPIDQSVANSDGGRTGPITLHQSIPQISTAGDENATYNEAAAAFANMIWTDAGGPAHDDRAADDSTDFSLDYTRNMASVPAVLSIKFDLDIAPRGAAHDGDATYNFNWNGPRGRPVLAADVFNPATDWKPRLAQLVTAQLRQETDGAVPLAKGQYDAGVSEAAMAALTADPRRWIITKDGLEVDFSLEEIGHYDDGEPSTTVIWRALRPFLKIGGLSY